MKIFLSLYLSQKSSDFNEIWYADGGESAFTYYGSSFSQCDSYDVGISQHAGASAGPQAARARRPAGPAGRRGRRRPAARIAAAVYVSPELYSLPVSQEFASLRPPLGGRTRLVNVINYDIIDDVNY